MQKVYAMEQWNTNLMNGELKDYFPNNVKYIYIYMKQVAAITDPCHNSRFNGDLAKSPLHLVHG